MTNTDDILPPACKKRRIDLKSPSSLLVNINISKNVSSSILETREILEYIHSFLNLEEILLSRLVCSFWNYIFKLTVSESCGECECNIFPLFMRQKFEETIGNFKQFLLFFICEYRNYSFKMNLKLKSSIIYPYYHEFGIYCDRLRYSSYPNKTRFNFISSDKKQYKLYQNLIAMFMIEIKRKENDENISLHNILFSWLRGLKNLSLYWLNNYNTQNLKKDLEEFHKILSCDYIEPEYGNSIPLLQSMNLTKFDYLSSFLGLLTLNGDFELFYKLLQKIEFDAHIMRNNKVHNLFTIFPREHRSNHIYNRLHTFGFGYNVYGLCKHKLFELSLKLCNIPRSICSIKLIRFVIQPHLLINIQCDLIKHKYNIYKYGNILNVSLNARIVTIKKLCFYFDLCATIHSSNLNRGSIDEYLISKQLQLPYFISSDECSFFNKDCHGPVLINNYQFWKRYILLSHLLYFVQKYKDCSDIYSYLKKVLLIKPKEIEDGHWRIIKNLIKKVNMLYPQLENEILKQQNILSEGDAFYIHIESYLKRQFNQYKSAVTLLDVIGAVYANNQNRNALQSMERMGPININQYQQLRQCILSSQYIRDFYIKKYDIDTFYMSIKNISFHDSAININDDSKYINDSNIDIGLFLKH